VPGVELSTDLIVGFPSETDEDFERTLYCLEQVRFSQVFAFKYSQRPGTDASKMEDDVPREVKEERLARVIALQDRINAEKQAAYAGTLQEVLIDGASTKKRGHMVGRTDGFKPVSVDAAHLEIGDIVQVRITGHEGHWLNGELVNAPAAATA
jgi:tRNA-2-methylthio-N6-dimethylallyladenosine synthase